MPLVAKEGAERAAKHRVYFAEFPVFRFCFFSLGFVGCQCVAFQVVAGLFLVQQPWRRCESGSFPGNFYGARTWFNALIVS